MWIPMPRRPRLAIGLTLMGAMGIFASSIVFEAAETWVGRTICLGILVPLTFAALVGIPYCLGFVPSVRLLIIAKVAATIVVFAVMGSFLVGVLGMLVWALWQYLSA